MGPVECVAVSAGVAQWVRPMSAEALALSAVEAMRARPPAAGARRRRRRRRWARPTSRSPTRWPALRGALRARPLHGRAFRVRGPAGRPGGARPRPRRARSRAREGGGCCTTSARSRSPTTSRTSPPSSTSAREVMREHPVIGAASTWRSRPRPRGPDRPPRARALGRRRYPTACPARRSRSARV